MHVTAQPAGPIQPTPAVPAAPAARLDLPKRRAGPGAVVSFLVHSVIVLLVFWPGVALLQQGAGGEGPRGGGGGRAVVSWFALLAPSQPVAVEVPAVPALVVPIVPPPEVVKIDVPQFPVPHQDVSEAAASGGRAGAGTGGGPGTGTGTGAGSATGPGTGGEGGYISPATPRWAVMPPPGAPAAERGRHVVRFWVTAEGRVTRVEVTPPIKDAAYRRRFIDAMMSYLFNPATTRDGQRVENVTPVTVFF